MTVHSDHDTRAGGDRELRDLLLLLDAPLTAAADPDGFAALARWTLTSPGQMTILVRSWRELRPGDNGTPLDPTVAEELVCRAVAGEQLTADELAAAFADRETLVQLALALYPEEAEWLLAGESPPRLQALAPMRSISRRRRQAAAPRTGVRVAVAAMLLVTLSMAAVMMMQGDDTGVERPTSADTRTQIHGVPEVASNTDDNDTGTPTNPTPTNPTPVVALAPLLERQHALDCGPVPQDSSTSRLDGLAVSDCGWVMASRGGSVLLWTPSATPTCHALVLRQQRQEAGVRAMAISPDAYMLLTADQRGHVAMWKGPTYPGGPAPRGVLMAHGGVCVLAFARSGDAMMGGGEHGNVWWLPLGHHIDPADVRTRQHEATVRTLDTSPDGHWLLVGTAERTVIWPREVFVDPMRGSTDVDILRGRAGRFSADGRWVVAQVDDRTLGVWAFDPGAEPDTDRARYSATLPHDMDVTTFAIAPDGGCVVAGQVDGTLRAWRLGPDGPMPDEAVEAHDGPVIEVAFAPGGRVVTAGPQRVETWRLNRE